MKFTDLFPPLNKFTEEAEKVAPKIIIANRAPTEADETNHQWWYDKNGKTMYRASFTGYVKD